MSSIIELLTQGGGITGIIAQLLTIVLGIGTLGAILIKYLKPVKETAELMEVIVESFADGKLSEDEIKQIIKEAKDIPESIANLKAKQ